MPEIYPERIIPDGQSGVEWANTGSLARADFFLVSQELYTFEETHKLEHFVNFPRSLCWSRRFEYPWALLNSELDDEDIVLDAGGGESSFTVYVASKLKGASPESEGGLKIPPQLHNLDLFDWRENVLEEQKQLKQRAKLHWYYPRKGDIRWPPYPVETFDKIFCISVIEHLPDKDRIPAVKTLLGLLKPNGILMLTVDVHKDPKSGFTLKDTEHLGLVFGLKIPPKLLDLLTSHSTMAGRKIARDAGERTDDPTEVICFKAVKSRIPPAVTSKIVKRVR